MLKSIFGKGQAKDQAIKMKKNLNTDQYKLFPVLKPGSWQGIDQGAVVSTLVPGKDQPKVVIGFAYDAPDNLIFLTHGQLGNRTGKEVIGEAFNNIEKYDTKFEISQKLEGRVLFSSGSDFASERILSESHMKKAHELLGANELLVSVPRRTCMMVSNYNETNKALRQQTIALHKRAWNEPEYGNEQITDILFVVAEGKIVGTL